MGNLRGEPSYAVDFIRRRPAMYVGQVPPTAEQLVDALVADAQQWDAQVIVEHVGLLSVVHGSPDWLEPQGEFWFHHFGSGPELLRQPVLVTAFAAVVATRRRAEPLIVVAGSVNPPDAAALATVGRLSARLIVFALSD